MSYKWSWMGDGGWVAFDAKKQADLEKGYLAKAKSVNLDKERFVDLSLSYAEIVKNFTNLTEKTLVGIQRRFDDHNKRRAVKREKDSTSFFENKTFAFLPQLQGVSLKVKDKEIIANVKTYGGATTTSLSKSVDYLIVMGTSPPDASAETMTAESLKVPIVYASFITKCILEGKLVDHATSVVPVKAKKKVDDEDEEMEEEGEEKPKKKGKAKKSEEDEEEEEKPKKKGKGKKDEEEEEEEKPKKKGKSKSKKDEEEEEEEKPKKKGSKKAEDDEEEEKPKKKAADKKRKADDDDEEDEEPKKKTKVDTDTKTTSSSTTTTSSSGSIVKKGSSSTLLTPPAGSTLNGLHILQPGTDWMGVCTDPTEGSHFPFLLQVLKIQNSSFEGFIFWKTLNDAQTKIRGKFAPNGNGGDLDIDIEEYEAVKGEDELELPMTYSGVLSGKSISGRVGDKASKSTFKLDLIKTVPFKVCVPTTWKGTCKTDLPFTLNIATREDDEVNGTIDWQTKPVTVTKWRGKIEGLNMTVEEYEVVKGDDEFLLRTWKLAVNQDEALSVKTADNETFTIQLNTK